MDAEMVYQALVDDGREFKDRSRIARGTLGLLKNTWREDGGKGERGRLPRPWHSMYKERATRSCYEDLKCPGGKG